MRRRIGAVALATTALLIGVTAGAAHADTPSLVAPAAVLTDDPPVVSDGDAPTPPADSLKPEVSRELTWIRGGREAADATGFEPSLYTGKWFMPGKEDVRRCIVERESHSNYRANNGSYFGAYQMSSALAVGATWMMQAEVKKEFGDEGEKIVKMLRKLTPDKWNRYWQDRAFWTIWSAPEGRGPGHWGGAGC